MNNLETVVGKSKEEIEKILRTKMGGAIKNILELHYGLNGKTTHTHGSIANKLNITAEKARQIEVKAIRLLIKRSEA